MEDVEKNLIKDQMKLTIIKYFWNMYKMTIADVFDSNGENFFKFVESINLREELPKVATNEYLNIVKEYSKFKSDNNID